VTDVTRRAGHDGAGAYTEIDFAYRTLDARRGSIRTYVGAPVVLFSTSYPDGGANTSPFPVLSSYPGLPYQQSYHGCFGPSQFDTTAGAADSPWLFFDHDANGFLLSPASHFPVARTWQDGGAIASGIDPAITTVPAGTVQQKRAHRPRGQAAPGQRRRRHARQARLLDRQRRDLLLQLRPRPRLPGHAAGGEA
jgi:hypothetical protein